MRHYYYNLNIVDIHRVPKSGTPSSYR